MTYIKHSPELVPEWRRTDNGCLIALNASRTKEGYARCNRRRFGRTVYLRHRLAWIEHHQRLVPEGKTVAHTCGRLACEEPTHLILAEHPWRKWNA